MGTSNNKRRRLVVPAALVAVAAAGAAAISTGAWFTGNATVNGNSFTAGTVTIGVTPATAAIGAGNMAPGDVQYGKIVVSNTGSLQQRYAVTESATNTDGKNLAGELNFDAVAIANGATCDATAFAGTPTLLTAPGNTFANTTVFGNPAQGSQAGDRVLNAGASENLCFRVSLPLTADNSYQGATTTGTLTFSAEQTANNA